MTIFLLVRVPQLLHYGVDIVLGCFVVVIVLLIGQLLVELDYFGLVVGVNLGYM